MQSAIKAIVEKLGLQLVDLFECSLLQNKLKEYLATSWDGWLVICYESSDNEHFSDDSYSEDAGCVIDCQNFNCGLEIQPPSSKKFYKTKLDNPLIYVACSHNANLEVQHSSNSCTNPSITFRFCTMLQWSI